MAFLKAVFKAFSTSHCTMHAAGLTYYSMLSIVPVLCIVLVCAKMLGAGDCARESVHAKIEAMIADMEKAPDDAIAALGLDAAGSAVCGPELLAERRRAAAGFAAQAREIESGVFDAIDRIDISSLGWIGFGALLWTVLSSIGMVGVSFGEIWRIEKPRPFFKRLGANALALVALPVFAALALSCPLLKLAKDIITATAGAVPFAGGRLAGAAACLLDSWPARTAVSLFFASLAFAFLFRILVPAKTCGKTAWKCGLATALLFSGWLKLCTVAQIGIARSSALYGSLAFLPIMLAWLYMSWQIVLLGCCIHKVAETGSNAP